MATKKVGDLIKEARTNAGFTQEALAKKIKTLTATDISKAERGEKDLTNEELKQIAKLTGVTQKSLLEAPKGAAAKKTTTTAKKPATVAKKPATATGTTMKLTATEKKLVEYYRAADSDSKKAAVSILKGEKSEAAKVIDTMYHGLMNALKVDKKEM